MDVFMQSDTKRLKLSEEDENKILLLQVKVNEVDKQILDFPKIHQSFTSLSNDFSRLKAESTSINQKLTTVNTGIQELKKIIEEFKKNISSNLFANKDFIKQMDAKYSTTDLKKNLTSSQTSITDLKKVVTNLPTQIFNDKNFKTKFEEKYKSLSASNNKTLTDFKTNTDKEFVAIKNSIEKTFGNKDFEKKLDDKITASIADLKDSIQAVDTRTVLLNNLIVDLHHL